MRKGKFLCELCPFNMLITEMLKTDVKLIKLVCQDSLVNSLKEHFNLIKMKTLYKHYRCLQFDQTNIHLLKVMLSFL